MRYYHETRIGGASYYSDIYVCNHPVYRRCTLYSINKKGLAVIRQYYDEKTKHTYWKEIDPWLADDIFLNKKFMDYFNKHASIPSNDIYPTVTVRQIMWALRMKPLKREIWETVFDHCPI